MDAQEQSSLGMDANIAAGLSQILGLVTGLIFFFIESKSQFVKFNAMQITLLHALMIVLGILMTILSGIMIFTPPIIAGSFGLIMVSASSLIWLGTFILWVIMLINAFQGKVFKLPVIGQLAEDYAIKSLASNSQNPPPMP